MQQNSGQVPKHWQAVQKIPSLKTKSGNIKNQRMSPKKRLSEIKMSKKSKIDKCTEIFSNENYPVLKINLGLVVLLDNPVCSAEFPDDADVKPCSDSQLGLAIVISLSSCLFWDSNRAFSCSN